MPQVSASPEVSKLAIADAMAGTPPALSAHRARLVHPRPGLRLHAEDAFDPVDARAQGTCVPGLHLVVLLEGQLDLTYGRQRVALSTRCEAAPVAPKKQKCGGKARLLLFYAQEPDTFIRCTQQGCYARRVCLNASPEWLEPIVPTDDRALSGGLRRLFDSHLAVSATASSPRAVALAEQLLRPPELVPPLQAIYLESRALDLLGEALRSVADPVADGLREVPETGLSAREYARMRELREFLSSESALHLSLEDVAGRMGLTANTMQRQFRAAYGVTAFAYWREIRMQRARQSLEQEAASIKQAAFLAGYTTPANFATAYKRRFGVTPREARLSAG